VLAEWMVKARFFHDAERQAVPLPVCLAHRLIGVADVVDLMVAFGSFRNWLRLLYENRGIDAAFARHALFVSLVSPATTAAEPASSLWIAIRHPSCQGLGGLVLRRDFCA
jgi:hypothetical protein